MFKSNDASTAVNDSVEKVKKSEEYMQNEMQINTIKDVLINHSDVPEKLVNWLIDAVEKNTELVTEAKLKSANTLKKH